jgi:tetratricopeptide (TPR) repeat protein
MKRNVFDPLAMDNTYVNEPDGVLPDSNRAKGISRGESGLVLNDHSFENGMYGDGGIISTVKDMLKWDQALYTEKLVSTAALAEALRPGSLSDGRAIDYGFGWSIIATDAGKMVAHGGGWLGFRAFFLRDIPSRNTIIQLCNMPGISRGELVFAINRILHGEDYELPKKSIAELMMEEIRRNGLESALARYRELRQTARDQYTFAERELNRVGYELLESGRADDAIEIFKLNIEMYPEAFNVYDSLGEAYMINGDRELAIENYEKSLELNSGNRNARKKLMELKRKE